MQQTIQTCLKMSYQTTITQKKFKQTFRIYGRLKNRFLASLMYYCKLNRQLKNSTFSLINAYRTKIKELFSLIHTIASLTSI